MPREIRDLSPQDDAEPTIPDWGDNKIKKPGQESIRETIDLKEIARQANINTSKPDWKKELIEKIRRLAEHPEEE